jgi:hypothetical protein
MYAPRASRDLRAGQAWHGTRPAPATRCALYVLATLLWASGAMLLALQLWFRQPGEFGLVRHPAEPALHTTHGVLAVLGLFGLGWISARHAGAALASSGARRGGPVLLAALGLLAASGFALYYLSADAVRAASSWLHAGLGAVVILPALWHWRGRGRQRDRSAGH